MNRGTGGSGVHPADQKAVADILERLRDLGPEDDRGSTPAWLVPAVRDLLHGGLFIAYRPERGTDGRWEMGERVTSDDGFFSKYNALLAREDTPFNYNPLRPERVQRNRVCFLREIHRHGPEATCAVENVWPQAGIDGSDQIRVLVCESDSLLSFVGGLRDEPFSSRERAAFAALVPALIRALALRRRLLDAALAAAGLGAALEALGAPSFIARSDGRVAHANATGTSLLDASPRRTTSRLRDAISRPSGNLVSRLRAPGAPEFYLVVMCENQTALDQRLHAVAGSWAATARELAVLRWLVTGDANKEIAVKLNCSEVSVERRVTALLRKARCEGRSRMMARFWGDL